MRYQLDSSPHSVYSLNYHLIFCVKYRRKVLTDEISKRLKDIIIGVSKDFQIKIIEQETSYIIQDKTDHQYDKLHQIHKRCQFKNFISRISRNQDETMERTLVVEIILSSYDRSNNFRCSEEIC